MIDWIFRLVLTSVVVFLIEMSFRWFSATPDQAIKWLMVGLYILVLQIAFTLYDIQQELKGRRK